MSILYLNNISKSFYGVPVLKNVSLEVKPAEIHGLIGENGAGKSTLMNITSGMFPCDEGEVFINGIPYIFTHPIEAEKQGIVHIHQELNILPELTIAENLFLGKELHHYGVLKKKDMEKKSQEIFKRLGQDLDISTKAGSLSLGHQQIIEVAKSLLNNNTKLIILDEPTSSLANNEINKLFEIITYLKDKEKVSFIYVSHRMNELFHICDRLTVLRDGEHIGTKKTSHTNIHEIVSMMIGRTIDEQYGHGTGITEKVYNQEAVLKVKNICKRNKIKNISFELYNGEILGFYGLVGAGRTDVLKAIFGVYPLDSGQILLNNTRYEHNTPHTSIQKGIGFLSEDRKAEGVFSNLSVAKNVSISNFREMSVSGVILSQKERDITQKFINMLSVKVSNVDNSILSLSGGNQQKTLLSRCFNYPLQVLLLDEPTRGIDIGSKHDIYRIMREIADTGVGIIMVSSDLLEVIKISDRIAVMHEGKLMKILTREEANQETIMHLSTNTHNNIGGKTIHNANI